MNENAAQATSNADPRSRSASASAATATATAASDSDPAATRAVARARLTAGDTAGAAVLVEDLMRKSPNDPETLLLAADLSLSRGSNQNARAILNVILAVDGDSQAVWSRLNAIGGAYPRRPMLLSQIAQSQSFFHQKLTVRYAAARRPLFVDRLRGKRVLHVGCVDHPIFRPETNLHVYLDKFAGELHGCDTAVDGIPALQRFVRGPIFRGLDEVVARGERYDAVLVPEVLEHAPDANAFLGQLFRVAANEFIVTAPNFKPQFAQSAYNNDVFEELVHPDHKCYFSPYTLLASVAPFVARDRDGLELFLLEKHHSVCVWVHVNALAQSAGPSSAT